MIGKCNEKSDVTNIQNAMGNGFKGDPINMSRKWLLMKKIPVMSQKVQRQGVIRVQATNMKKFDLNRGGFKDLTLAMEIPSRSFTILRTYIESMPKMVKGPLQCARHNSKEAHSYSIVIDLAQSPSAMSALEVLQTCPTKKNPYFPL